MVLKCGITFTGNTFGATSADNTWKLNFLSPHKPHAQGRTHSLQATGLFREENNAYQYLSGRNKSF
eukprot:1841876-Amphidinium_carterae.1